MHWTKLGKVFSPAGEQEWMRSHATVPVAEWVEGDTFRIYFSSRDGSNRSHTGFVVIDLNRPQTILERSAAPVLSPGTLGAFDDSGAMATWLVRSGDTRYLYFNGWNLGVTVPFRIAIGLALAGLKTPFQRHALGPILDRTQREPYFCASGCVLPGEDRWRMWYVDCTGWSLVQGKPRHHYHIKYAESQDGIHWQREGRVAIDYSGPEEYAIARPAVVREPDGWKMWYSTRGQAYRIGYAESPDGLTWVRRDGQAGIEVSPSGWDSEMIEYPFVFDHRGQRFMLYNGNGYGRTGFGLAVLEAR